MEKVDDPPYLTPAQAVNIVREHGIMLESARGPVPSLASTAAGEQVPGNWWGHEKRYHIWHAINAIRESGVGQADVLVCRLMRGKVTYVHRDLWPALVRLSNRLDGDRLAWLHEVHSESGVHRVEEEPFPDWVPADVRQSASSLSESQAEATLGAAGATHEYEREVA